MKKSISLLLTLTLILSSMSFAGVFAANEEIVFSEDFESGIDNWRLGGTSEDTFGEYVTEPTKGSKTVHLTDNSAERSPSYTGPHFNVEAGASYTTVMDVKIVSGSSIKVFVKYFDANKKQIFSKSFGPSDACSWATVSSVTQAPEGAVYGNLVISGVNKPVGEAYIDNLKVYKGDVKVTTTEPSYILEPTPVETKEGIIIYSESFENGLNGWTYTNNSLKDKVSVVDSKASEGKKSVYLVDDATDKTPGIASPHFKIEAGKIYSPYADIATESGDSIKLYFKYFDKNKKQIANLSKGIVSEDWARIGLNPMAPEGAVSAQVWIVGTNAALGAAFADNIRVYEGVVQFAEPETEYIEPIQAPAVNAQIVAPVNNKLVYNTYNEQGDIIGDYSYAGYFAGQCELPVTAELPVVATLEPSADPKADDTARIQAAIDKAYSEASDDNLKVIRLKSGRYNISAKSIKLKSGILLSGEGQSEEGTVLYAYEASQYMPVKIAGSAPKAIGESVLITDDYVKAGSKTFNIPADKAAEFQVGDLITIFHPATDEWCKAMGMKGIINVYDNDTSWEEGKVDMKMERNITAINGTEITVDFPIFVPLAKQYAQSYVYKTSDAERVNNVGIENLRIESYYNGDPQDEKHATAAIQISNAKNVFVRDVSAKYFYSSIISSSAGAKQVTALNCSSLQPVSAIAGSRRYSFAVSTSAQQILYTGCYSYDGRHDFETSLTVTGPIAFVDNIVDKSNTASETHGTWSTGVLYDNLYQVGNATKGFLAFANRGIYGTALSQGWSAASVVAWNCLSTTIIGHKPPLTYQNFIVGNWGYYGDTASVNLKANNTKSYTGIYRTAPKVLFTEENFATKEGTSAVGDCYKEAEFTPVEPRSLFKAQLAERFTGNIQNARPNAPVIVYPRSDKKTDENEVAISGAYQAGAEKVTVYIDNTPYEATLDSADNSFKYTMNMTEGTHKIYATQTINGVEGTKTADRFITVGKSNGYQSYLSSVYAPEVTKLILNDPRPSYSEFIKNNDILGFDEISVVVNGVKLIPDVKPYETNGRVLVPMRAIFEALSADVAWDETTATATAKNFYNEVKITENSTTAYVNGNPVTLDVPATITNGRFMVPVRFISESFGADVGWNESRLTVTVDLINKIFEPSHNLPGELRIVKAIQSGDDGAGAVIDNIFDNNNTSKWAVLYTQAAPDGAYGIFDLGTSKELDSMYIAFASGNKRVYTVDIYVSDDNVNYTFVKTFSSSGATQDFEQTSLGTKGRYVKIVGKGNSANNWMSILEFAITGK